MNVSSANTNLYLSLNTFKAKQSVAGISSTALQFNEKTDSKREAVPQKFYLASLGIQPRSLNSSGNVAFLGNTANFINKVVSITEGGEAAVLQRPDGGYLVDKITNTIVYYGREAKAFLERTKVFTKETEIITQSGCSLGIIIPKINSDGYIQKLMFSDPGAILIEPETRLDVKILKGNPLVITTEKKPDWYNMAGPEGEHKNHFDQIADINKRLYKGHILKSLFTDEETGLLLSAHIIKPVDNNYVEFNKFVSEKQLRNNLSEFVTKKQVEKIASVWKQVNERLSSDTQNCGEILKNTFDSALTQRLMSSKIIASHPKNDKVLVWNSFFKEEELMDRLAEAQISRDEAQDIRNVWKNTTRSGFDNSGLTWLTDGVTVYSHKYKTNLWAQTPTEWIVNSDAKAGKAPFVTGVSRVYTENSEKTPVDFNKIRAAEVLHSHPTMGEKRQTEVYLVTQGKAAFLSMQNGRPNVSVLNEGNMAIINPDVAHRLIGIDGEYEHLVCQVPSAFQYGFAFKNEQKYSDYGITEQEVLKTALDKLSEASVVKEPINENVAIFPKSIEKAAETETAVEVIESAKEKVAVLMSNPQLVSFTSRKSFIA